MSREVSDWVRSIEPKRAKRFIGVLKELETEGPNLKRPRVDSIRGSQIQNLKELRMGTDRVLFCFSRNRNALLLVAGDKRSDWSGWYQEAIARAEQTLKEEFNANR